MNEPAPRPTRCQAPGCDNPLPPPAPRGRPRLYCSSACRQRTAPAAEVLTVEVDHDAAEDVGRPLGRVWLVRLRRGPRELVIASELGRPSADHLAAELVSMISARPWAKGAAME